MNQVVNRHYKLIWSFLIYLAIYSANLLLPISSSLSYTPRMWLLSSILIIVLSLFVLLKEGLPTRKKIYLGLTLAFLVALSSPTGGAVTFFSFLSASRIFEIHPLKIQILQEKKWISIVLGLGVGIVLGTVNLLLASGQTMTFLPSIRAFLVSLNPGIHEGVAYRFFIYAFSAYLLGGEITNRKEQMWVYVLMVVPHVLLHFPDQFFVEGVLTLNVGGLLSGIVLLSLLFGLPFALLMVKRDLTTSIVAHTIVDFIRFIFYGLPF